MADISKITLPSGTTYDLKDAQARSDIATLQSDVNALSSSKIYIGESSTSLTDGATVASITVTKDGTTSTVTPTAGQFVTYGKKEFVVGEDGTWHEFGDASGLGDLAYKDSATATYKPAGSITGGAFTGQSTDVSVSGTPKGTVSIAAGTVATETPSNYTPAGSISQSTAAALNTTTVNSITGVGSLPSWTGTVSGETLTIGWSAGSLPTKGANQTVATGIKTQPAYGFTGTAARLNGTFVGESLTSTGKVTPKGSNSALGFSGTQATITVK